MCPNLSMTDGKKQLGCLLFVFMEIRRVTVCSDGPGVNPFSLDRTLQVPAQSLPRDQSSFR